MREYVEVRGLESFKEEVVIDDHCLIKGETIDGYLRKSGFGKFFNEISNRFNVYYILDEDGNELKDFSTPVERDTQIRLCEHVINYSFDDIKNECPWIFYEDYVKEVQESFIYNGDKSYSPTEQLYLVYFCDEWITSSSMRIIGVLTENALRDLIVRELKVNKSIEWNSHYSPQTLSLDLVRKNLTYLSFDPIDVNDFL